MEKKTKLPISKDIYVTISTTPQCLISFLIWTSHPKSSFQSKPNMASLIIFRRLETVKVKIKELLNKFKKLVNLLDKILRNGT